MRKVKSLQKLPFPQPDVITKVVPAPTEGWDAISPLSSMDPKRAPILNNWVPRPGYVELRAGYTRWSLLTNSPVETLMVRRGSTEEMFAVSGGKIFDVSTLSSAVEKVTGLASNRMQYINFTPDLGTTVIQCVNGIDSLRQYDGASWTTPSITGLPLGLNTTNITNIYAQKKRIWYVMDNGAGDGSTIVCFMPVAAISGAIGGSIDLGGFFTKGGYVVAMGDWTVDGGNGPQDYAVFISSRGQVVIFAGTDPASSTNWSLVGVFDISPPIGRRCFCKVGADLVVITQDGVIPISQALPFDPSADRSVSVTARIQNAMAQAAAQAANNFGWQFLTYPMQQLGILNVPLTENNQQVQFVMNTLTGAWCQFTNWNFNCFEIFNNQLYSGDNVGGVNWCYQGGVDLTETIQADMQCAYNWFDDPGRTKRMTMVQPMMVASGNLTPTISVDEDFQVATAVAPVSILAGGALWDSAVWDASLWSGGTQVVNPWLSAEAIGHALAIHLTVNISPGTVVGDGGFDVSTFDNSVFDAGGITSIPTLQINAFNAIMELGGFV